MRTVHKQTLSLGKNIIEVPDGSSILHVAAQGPHVTVWYSCDLSRSVISRVLHVVGTGMQVPDNTVYLGTAFVDEYVWHVFGEPLII